MRESETTVGICFTAQIPSVPLGVKKLSQNVLETPPGKIYLYDKDFVFLR